MRRGLLGSLTRTNSTPRKWAAVQKKHKLIKENICGGLSLCQTHLSTS